MTKNKLIQKRIDLLSYPVVYLVLTILGFIIYSNTFKSSFVFDDFFTIVGNYTIHRLTDLPTIWQAFNTRFVVGVSLALNYALGKENVVGYHLFNTLVHILNSYLVYQFVCLTLKTPRMTKTLSIDPKLVGFLTALLFLTHPIQTQAVTYIWQRATSLASFFYLGALVFYVRSRLKPSLGDYGICLLFTVFGMFTKEIVFTLPFMIGLYEFVFLKHASLKTARKILLWLPLTLTLFIIPWTMTKTSDQTLRLLNPKNTHLRHQENFIKNIFEMTRAVSKEEMPRKDFILTELNVLRTYLRLFLLPVRQSVDYNYPRARSLMEPNTFLSFLLLISLLSSGLLLLKKCPLLAFGIFWFFLTISVESLVAQGSFFFEHRLYLPMLGFNVFLVTALTYLFKNSSRGLTIVVLGIATCYSFLSYQRNFVWKDEFTLWNDAVNKFPHNSRAYSGRGNALLRNGFRDRALLDLNKAIELKPNNAEAYTNRGFLYESKGLLEQAMADCNKAIEINPKLASAYNNRAVVYKNQGRLDNVLADLNKMIQLEPYKAMEINPKIAVVYNDRASAYGMKGLLDEALLDCNKAIRLCPTFAEAYNNRAIIYKNKDLLDQALSDFNKAIELNPGFASAYYNRANLYFLKKEYDKSWQDVKKTESFGYVVNPQFIEKLKKASGKQN